MELQQGQARRGDVRKFLVAVGFVMALTAACTSTRVPITAANTDSTPAIETTTSTVTTTTTTSSTPIPTAPSRIDPTYYSFQETLQCDPDSDQAALHVVQAFFTAYNQRDMERLAELVSSDLSEIWDPSALSHTDQVLNTDVTEWVLHPLYIEIANV